jgi:hypothetical protein
MPGSYSQRTGRHLGAQLDLTTRDGSREGFRGRGGLSGTSAALVGEGPFAGARGSWLASVRRSYLDRLIKQIDEQSSFAFGFTDGQGKVVFDLSPRHQLEGLVILGRSNFEEGEENLSPNDEATAGATTWLSSFTWRYTPNARFVTTQKLSSTGVRFDNRNALNDVLDRGRSVDVGWRSDNALAFGTTSWLEFGGDAQHLGNSHLRQRAIGVPARWTPLSDYSAAAAAGSAYAQVRVAVGSRLTLTPGGRVDYWGATSDRSASPWIAGSFVVDSRTRLRAGSGIYRQMPLLDQIYGLNGGGVTLRHERAHHVDVGIERQLGHATLLQVTGYARNESDVLWPRGFEPRRLANGGVQFGRGDATWVNALDGRSRGVEVVLRRDAASGLTGWGGYAYGHTRYTDTLTAERFDADVDQRHTLSLYAHYRLSARTSVSGKFRYGSNYPITGYIGAQSPPPGTPALFDGQPLFYTLTTERNGLRLPAYARLDVRADRTFMWWGRRTTLFVELGNALNRTNLRATPYDIDRNGRVFGPTESMIPLFPSAGFVVDF